MTSLGDPTHNSQFTIHNSQLENPTTIWATLFVSALAHAGLDTVVICPGSRSTPLTLAFDAHPGIEVVLQLDERSGAFFALGRALAAGKPVAVVCTSGTAAANFYPSIIEAKMSHVPLIVLTADRPPELRHSGANQTIDQVKMFGDNVLWAVDMDVPTAAAPEVALRNVAQTAARAYHTAAGRVQGPVQVNFPFRKPLEPEGSGKWEGGSEQFSVFSGQWVAGIERGVSEPSAQQVGWLVEQIKAHPKGVIVCGPSCPEGAFAAAVFDLAHKAGYPIFADPLSGLRYRPDHGGAHVISGYETWLAGGAKPKWDAPDVVIRFGAVPTSKWLNQWLGDISPQIRLHVRENGVWADDSHLTTDFWAVNEASLCQQTVLQMGSCENGYGQRIYSDWEESGWRAVAAEMPQANFDVPYLMGLLELMGRLSTDSQLLIGNSLPVRHLDQFGRAFKAELGWQMIRPFGNRGASGIDGVVSTACGIASAGRKKPTVLVIGDISFFHDMNGLLLARHFPNLTIVLFNNSGGHIFQRLPVSQFDPSFTELFLTPHDFDFAHTAAFHNLQFSRVSDWSAFQQAFRAAVADQHTHLIEIVTNGVEDEQMRRGLVARVKEAMGGE